MSCVRGKHPKREKQNCIKYDKQQTIMEIKLKALSSITTQGRFQASPLHLMSSFDV
jgi:hypothetical protein